MKIEDNFLVIENTDNLKYKKVTGHSFVDLLGFNKFKKVGDALLSLHGLYTEEVDKKWLYRGDLAEKIVKVVYERDGHKCTTYDEAYKKAHWYTNFDNLRAWGGLIDIELIEEKKLVEVKGKSMKSYEDICKEQPKDEIYQGLYYAYLRQYEEADLYWVFFDKETEDEVFTQKKPTTLKNLKKLQKTYKVDRSEMKSLLVKVQTIVNEFRKTKKIPLDLISKNVLGKLGLGNLPQDNTIEKLPFE